MDGIHVTIYSIHGSVMGSVKRSFDRNMWWIETPFHFIPLYSTCHLSRSNSIPTAQILPLQRPRKPRPVQVRHGESSNNPLMAEIFGPVAGEVRLHQVIQVGEISNVVGWGIPELNGVYSWEEQQTKWGSFQLATFEYRRVCFVFNNICVCNKRKKINIDIESKIEEGWWSSVGSYFWNRWLNH